MKIVRYKFIIFVFIVFEIWCVSPEYASQVDIPGPIGSGRFGNNVTVLPNGNFVVVDPLYDEGGVNDIGAVYVYDGGTLNIISKFRGSTLNDQVGSHGIVILGNGNFVIRSPLWDVPSPTVSDAGAATWCSASIGCNGVVSASNSIVGSSASDFVSGSSSSTSASASGGVIALANSNYVVYSPRWDNPSPAIVDAGAATWGSGNGGTVGAVSSTSSLVGGTANDAISAGGIVILTNGNYVVKSRNWNNPSPALAGVGAITWGNGVSGTRGLVTSLNSLVGGTANDDIGGEVKALTNGNYVVASIFWNNPSPFIHEVGAVTWCSGNGGTVGVITAANSLVGTKEFDGVGGSRSGIAVLPNGNYVVGSSSWSFQGPSGLVGRVGAATWGNGNGGTVGPVTASNSLVGGRDSDEIGDVVVTLTNGNYVVSSGKWDLPTSQTTAIGNVGAVTWCNGNGSTVGVVTNTNSLVGGRNNDQVGVNGVFALNNGNYVVGSPSWDNPSPVIADVGAATWGNGNGGTVGTVTSANSLTGGSTDDQVGVPVVALTNGNYVVNSRLWNNPSPAITDVGAVTWGNGNGGTVGLVTATNSLVGGSASDGIGSGNGIFALSNGHYVVASPDWDNPSGSVNNAGAATWGNGNGGTVGLVTSSNSLVGSINFSNVGNGGIFALTNGKYIVSSPVWNNPSPAISLAGAVSLGDGFGGTVGSITSSNSVLGTVQNGLLLLGGGPFTAQSYDYVRSRLLVGRGASNIVSIFSVARRIPFDYDGDGKSDLSVYRPSNGLWFVSGSGGSGFVTQLGNSTDKIAPADFDGDGKTDVAVYRPSQGGWFVMRSSTGVVDVTVFGAAVDLPVPGDYDGDGKADVAVYRPTDGTWYVLKSSGGTSINQFGANGDVPAPGDYDGDGKNDLVVWRPSNGVWFERKSTQGDLAIQFGASADKIAPADYDGDGKTDVGIYRPSQGTWYSVNSSNGGYPVTVFGVSSDIPVPADYDGDGRADVGVFRPSDRTWYLNRTTSGLSITQFGVAGDKPTPNAFGN